MDDLSGIDWSKPAPSQPKPAPMRLPTKQPAPSLRPTPSILASGRGAPASSATTDSFSNLLGSGQAKLSQNLTLAERQAQLEAEKRKRDDERRKQSEAQFGSAQQWDALGSRAFTPSPSLAVAAEDDDLFAAFNKDTKVDNASHYPPPAADPPVAKQLDLRDPTAWSSMAGLKAATLVAQNDDDDDPFGLGQLKSSSTAPSAKDDDDDFLGDLGRPVDEVRKKRQETVQPEPGKPIEHDDGSSSSEAEQSRRQPRPRSNDDTLSRAVAQLVDYGFSSTDAMRGLKQTGNNPQAAANWLLDEAHRKAKQKSQGRTPSAGPNRSPIEEASGEPDFAKSAAAVGTSLFKTANSLWKTGQKKMQRAVADFQQQEEDTGRPKWMRDVSQEQRPSRATAATATDEALALESAPPAPTRAARSTSSSGSQSRSSPAPRWQQQLQPPPMSDARSRLNRLAADDDDSFSGYVSAGRRRKPTSSANPPVRSETQPSLMPDAEAPKPSRPMPHRPTAAPIRNPAPTRNGPKPAPPMTTQQPAPRRIPPIDSAALQASTRHRLQGTAHFKRGDFATAHASYSSSMAGVPSSHPLMIVLLTNRALTALKTGEPKQAVSDADDALSIIGPNRGRDEVVSVSSETGQEEKRPMTDLYGKALSRKAEALEQMEKWAEAGAVWQLCVEAGAGGPTAVKGRQRCQEAQRPKTTKAKPVAAPSRPGARPATTTGKSSAAVVRLREANEAAAREEDEKFALADVVDARVSAWRDGKRDNLRALLGSLDKVLWANSGWKPVGMHELVMANRVKVVYMKAIAKTHPDKLPQDANTEVRLVAGLVFSTLNESWDRFKADNGL
ncbi:UBA/TS-N domain-containing protein [Ophiocordyceps camponoti-floridani]|uniref:UBA/TS-N domain-containing protein n=1 Tax=Ophiocordyceps camponoti-floridani TaxID=2030778 RepID=A0A8H4Q5Y7_9HYPO|nr:UBA/TS-N domain-containing protein [Ophiocordyceps camponoti-floridani]